jgi:AcrR family transcriptional regulator
MEAISKAGLDLIYRHGYEGMTLRQLATCVGIQQGSLYNHFASKQDLLVHLYEKHMGELLEALDLALADVHAPQDRLDAFVEFHVRYHIDRKREVFVVNSELRSLEPANRSAATSARRRYEQCLIEILENGARTGTFAIADAPTTAFGLLGMLSGVSVWYDVSGRLSCEALVANYRELVRRCVRK